MTPKSNSVTESTFREIWKRQPWGKNALSTTMGERIVVHYPGRENHDAGPDFADAIIEIGGGNIHQGDVELHLRTSDWWSHKHHLDPNYKGVILHAVFWDDTKRPVSLCHRDTGIPIMSLSDCLTLPIEELCRTVYSSTPAIPPCRRTGQYAITERTRDVIQRAGESRFSMKKDQFSKAMALYDVEQVLYEGIMRALGYSKNTAVFMELAQQLPLSTLWRVVEQRGKNISTIEALLLGSAGMLATEKSLSIAASDKWAAEVKSEWLRLGAPQPMMRNTWRFFRIQPANSPPRRLAAMSELLLRCRGKLFSSMLSICQSYHSEIERRLAVTTRGYWATHFDLGVETKWNPYLIGKSRAREITVNILFPFFAAWAEHTQQDYLKRRILELYHTSHTPGENWITQFMHSQICGGFVSALSPSACHQQGLIQLYHDFCRNQDCSACPLRL